MTKPNKRYLDERDLTTLQEGFKRGRSADEIKMAEEVLGDLGYEKKSKAQKRPGPKRKGSLNQTDETLRRLAATIRAVLGLPDDTSKIATLTVLSVVIGEARQLFSTHFFVTMAEFHQMRSIFSRTEKSEYDFVLNSRPWIRQCLDELGRSSAKWKLSLWDYAAWRLPKFEPTKTSAGEESGEQQQENAIYSALASVLELDSRAWLDRYDKHTGGGTDAPSPGRPTLTEMGLSRGNVLVTAIGRLFHLESVFSKAQFLLSGDASEAIRMFLDEEQSAILHGPQPVQKIMGELADLFLSIGKRQGVYPCRLNLENVVLDRRPLTEGQISTGG